MKESRRVRGIVWAGVVCLGVIIVVGGYNVLASNVLHGPVNGRSLYVAVKNESGGESAITEDAHRTCRRTARPREWLCGVDEPSGSGGVEYRVRVKPDSSCWEGEASSGPLPRRITGCVHLQE